MRYRALFLALAAILTGAAVVGGKVSGDKASGDAKYKAGDYDGALKDYDEAIASLGAAADSEAAADLWLAAGEARAMQSDYLNAQHDGERALAIYTRLHGSEHRTVAVALNDIGLAVQGAGDYGSAASYFERALALARRLGDDGLQIPILERLAYNRSGEGDLIQAKLLQEETLALTIKLYGADSSAAGRAMRMLAQGLLEIGDYTGARRNYLKALEILEAHTGKDAIEVGDTLIAMSNEARNSGYPADGKMYAERAAAIYEKALGPRNTRLGGAFDNLGQALTAMRRYDDARASLERALAIQTAALGPRHPWTANVIQGLAKAEAASGNYSRARELYLQNLGIWREALGPTHPFVAVSMTLLADVLAHEGRYQEALTMALEAAQMRRDRIALTVRSVDERQALGYNALQRASMDVALSIVERPGAPASERTAAWDALIRSRALVLDEMAARHRSILESGDPGIAQLAERTAAARSALAKLVLQDGKFSPAEYGKRVEKSRADMDRLEEELAVKSAAFRHTLAQRRAGYEQVRASLPAGSGLVAFRRFERKSYTGGKTAAAYMAFVLGRDGVPVVVPLGAAEGIEKLATAWRAQMERERTSLGRAGRANEEEYRKAGTALRAAVWDPLRRHLTGARRVFVVPDGALQLVNMAALPAAAGGYLVESGPLTHMLSAERDLAAPAAVTRGAELLAVANPLFQSTPAAGGGGSEYRGAHSACAEFGRMQFGSLPASQAEADAILKIWRSRGWRAQELTGAGATEGAVKNAAAGKRVLHMATHGFFLDAACPETGAARENPLVRSGLALAGANRRQSAARDEEDGVLTAQEIASLDLENTEWVVLSGCDTGVGDIADGEGVLGLRRAFQEAGARTLVVSLWPVRDRDAQDWMTALYRSRFVERQGTAEAIRAADLTRLRARRAAGESTHPFYWAGFVAIGDWR
ncbi:MAG: type pilus biosis/stability protein PilW [Candidatus Solibacter sp.]|nr:type pilus biosis/stability protein PilW [Candidatus Solibacter sp.]